MSDPFKDLLNKSIEEAAAVRSASDAHAARLRHRAEQESNEGGQRSERINKKWIEDGIILGRILQDINDDGIK